jgi:cytochrome c oxidase subunit 3
MPSARLAKPYSDLAHQHETALFGIWVFLATEVLFFGGLILAYAVYRYGYASAFAEAARHTRIVIGTANTAILLTSSFLVAWAAEAAKTGANRIVANLFAGATALGCVFLILKGIEYRGEVAEHLFPASDFAIGGDDRAGGRLFFTFYFAATGLHAVHVGIGIAVLLTVAIRARMGRYSGRYHTPIVVAGLYWHFVDLVWIFLFALIYLPGRS